MADRFIAGSNDLFSGVMVGCNGTYRPIDPGGNPFTTLAPRSDVDVTTAPPYHSDAAMLTEYGRGNIDCFVEWWRQPPSTTAYPYQTGFLASDGQFIHGGSSPERQGMWLWWPQTLEFNFTPGQFLGKVQPTVAATWRHGVLRADSPRRDQPGPQHHRLVGAEVPCGPV